ncbi:WD repeat-containing protein 7-like isoform X1 [Mercenaria mercenaria]|uniref:WD repeat-containing protein 7-like isoform X1 n=1 Tax=Mercenaria mercenaria TaxID=6596 RepID=UPI00234F34A6|nr:WD repeat-containing protein 7-like isoform X1 [Mercenaria mercenaria]
MVVGNNIVVPVVLWGKNAPTHCISAIYMTPDMKNIVTACNDAQLCVWDFSPNWEVYPRHMLFGHTAAISCLAPASAQQGNTRVVSASENGEMCLWDIADGRCIETIKMAYAHSSMQAYHFRNTKDVRLVCNGYYPEIVIVDPLTFEIVLTLSSRVSPDWISACCVLRPAKREDDVIVAISNSGAVKVWALSGSENRSRPIHEDESKQIRCLNAQTLTCCPYNQRTVLIVCSKYWQIYDAGDFTLLCSESNRCGERWAGGDFLSVDRVVVWSNEGKSYLYKLPTNLLKGRVLESANSESDAYHHKAPSSPHAYYVLDFYSEKTLACSPAVILHSTLRGDNQATKLLVRGDSEGQVVIWKLPVVSERQMTLVRQESFDRLPVLLPKCSATLQDIWDKLNQSPSGILDGFKEVEDGAMITSTVYIPSQGKLVCGRSNGTIIILPATMCIMLQLLDNRFISHEKIQLLTLEGHDGRVNCLLYPFNESTRYEPKHLLSGGADFSVCLWDIYEGVKLHTFTVHGGEISQLMVPPNNCNVRILTSICSVASDHSVTLLSLKERKCILLASRHLFPVHSIRWRPLDDFMVVSCSDGTVYVWQMETGHLDRVVHGLTAEEILNNCDENAMPVFDQLTNPNLTLAQAFKRRNLATFKNLAQQKLQALSQNQQAAGAKIDLSQPQDYPMYIEGIRTNTVDPDGHVVFFDTEALIVQLLTNEFATMSPGELEAKGLSTLLDRRKASNGGSDSPPTIAGILAKVKDTADTVSQKIQAGVDAHGFQPINPNIPSPSPSRKQSQSGSPLGSPGPGGRKKRPEPLNLRNSNLTMEIAQLFMSMLHAWGLDPDLDKLCLNKLGLLKPKSPISFGLISREGHMSLMLPGWHKGVCSKGDPIVAMDTKGQRATLRQQTRSEMDPGSESDLINLSSQGAEGSQVSKVDLKAEIEKEIYMFTKKARWQISSAVTTQHLLSVISVANTLMSMNHATFRSPKPVQRQRSTRSFQGVHGMLVSEGDGSSAGSDEETGDALIQQQAQFKQGWSLLAAHHCVLLPELVDSGQYFSPQLEMLARRWQDRCLEIREAAQALLLAELRRIGPDGRKSVVDDWSPFLPTYVDPQLSILSTDSHPAHGEDEDEDDTEHYLVGDSPLHKPSRSFESRRKQATAIVMLAVLGAEFGHEVLPTRRGLDDGKKMKKGLEGFTLSNYSLAHHTSKALTFLLQHPPSKKLPAHTPIRRAAIDLIGRGFPVWEPYLDVSAILLGLLELCIGSERLVPSVTFGLPLSPAADACRTARHALSLIATARPATFVITMAREVTRHNHAMTQNTQSQHHSNPHNSVLVKSKPEILRVVELLVDKMPADVADQIVEAMEIIIHCLDASQLKAKGLQELFPAICRFSMVTCCSQTKRIWVGAKNGTLAFYELKQNSKCQVIQAHAGPVIATSISPDGKFLATFSHVDQKLKFWQTASTSLFGIGSQHTKCVRQIATQPIAVTPHTNLLKLVRLVWTDIRVLVLLTVDGTEHKYYV